MINQCFLYYKFFVTIFFIGSLISCVDNVSNPNDNINKTNEITITVYSPISNDSLHMGKNIINYTSLDMLNGVGLSTFQVFVGYDQISAQLLQSFYVDEKGNIPIIYIHSDSLEKKLNLSPYNLPSIFNYWITVYDKNGNYKISPTFTHLILDKKPEAPTNLTLNKITSTSYNLFWDDNSSNEDYYELWRKDGVGGVYQKIATLSKNTISKNENVYSSSVNYFFKIRATNVYGNSKFSNEVSIANSNIDGAPSNLVAQALGASRIQLNWKDNISGELGFRIQRALTESLDFVQIGIVAENVTEFVDENLSANTEYKYHVAAFTSSSQTNWSNLSYATTFNKDVPAPTGLVANFNMTVKAVELHWNDNTTLESGSIIERKSSAGDEYVDLAYTDQNVNSFFDYNVENNKIYYYRVRYLANEGFRTQPSNEDTAYVPQIPPKAPSNLKIYEFTAGSLYGLTWTDNSDEETSFQIERRESGTNNFKYIEISPNTTAYNDNVPSASNIYYYKIRSNRNGLYSAYSNEVSTSGSTSGLTAPSELKAEKVVSKLAVNLSWKDNSSNELGFIIERMSTDNPTYVEIKRVGPNVKSFEDNGPGIYYTGTFYYRIKAFNGQSESAYSSVAVINIQP